MSAALKAFGLPDDATPADVRAAYLERAKNLHPDRGGTPEAFAALNDAYRAALAAAKPAPCPACDGSGARVDRKGFYACRNVCGACRGTGYADQTP